MDVLLTIFPDLGSHLLLCYVPPHHNHSDSQVFSNVVTYKSHICSASIVWSQCMLGLQLSMLLRKSAITGFCFVWFFVFEGGTQGLSLPRQVLYHLVYESLWHTIHYFNMRTSHAFINSLQTSL
jgi:hypothetical protein